MSSFSHLAPGVVPALSFSTEERIHFAQRDHWIDYPRAKEALALLEDLLGYPRTLRMPNLLLVGDSGNGKSTIIERFRDQHPIAVQPTGEPLAPLVVMNMPSEPSETRFWSELLTALKIAHRDKETPDQKKRQAVSVLGYVSCRMLVIDEIHNLLYGSAAQQRHFLGVIKNLSNELRLPIVAVGTRDAIRALHTDPQLSNRFEAFGLPRWKLDRVFVLLLNAFERLLPLSESSDLTSKELAIKLHGMSGGTIGGLARLLKKATVAAIRSGKERIDSELLDGLGWVTVADYGKQASVL